MIFSFYCKGCSYVCCFLQAIENRSSENEDGLIESTIASDVNGLDYDSCDTNDFDDQVIYFHWILEK